MATKKVTEEDIHLTEAMIARSYNNMKQAVTKMPSDLTKPLSGVVKDHPIAVAAGAAGAGLIAYEFIRLITPRVVVKEMALQPELEVKGPVQKSDLTSQVISFAMPYLLAHLQTYLGKVMSGQKG